MTCIVAATSCRRWAGTGSPRSTPGTCQRFVDGLNRKGLAPKTVRGVYGTLSLILSMARRDGLARPVEGVRLPRVERGELLIPDADASGSARGCDRPADVGDGASSGVLWAQAGRVPRAPAGEHRLAGPATPRRGDAEPAEPAARIAEGWSGPMGDDADDRCPLARGAPPGPPSDRVPVPTVRMVDRGRRAGCGRRGTRPGMRASWTTSTSITCATTRPR